MIIKKAKFKNVKAFISKRISDDVYGCDQCKKVIPDHPNETQRLEITVFRHDNSTENLHYCSWKCVLKAIPNIKTDYFASLPFLYFDEGMKDRCAKELIDLIKKLK